MFGFPVVESEFGDISFCGRQKRSTRRKNTRNKEKANSKLDPHTGIACVADGIRERAIIQLDSSSISSRLRRSHSRLHRQNKSTHTRNPVSCAGYIWHRAGIEPRPHERPLIRLSTIEPCCRKNILSAKNTNDAILSRKLKK